MDILLMFGNQKDMEHSKLINSKIRIFLEELKSSYT